MYTNSQAFFLLLCVCMCVCVLSLTYILRKQIFIILGTGLNYQVHVIAIRAHASVMSKRVY